VSKQCSTVLSAEVKPRVVVEQSRDAIDHAVGIVALGGGLPGRVVDAIEK